MNCQELSWNTALTSKLAAKDDLCEHKYERNCSYPVIYLSVRLGKIYDERDIACY